MNRKATKESFLRRLLACLLSAALAVVAVPAAALASDADDAVTDAAEELAEGTSAEEEAAMFAEAEAAAVLLASGTVDCDNGWVLSYADVSGGLAITGVATAGSGSLTIPSTIGELSVVAIASSAFSGCLELGVVTIPSSVSSIGTYAFFNSGVTSVNIPAAVSRIAYRCFALCSSLTSVNFEGSSLRYLSQQSFYSCTSLTSIEIPLLTDTPTVAETQEDGLNDGSVSYGVSVGASCFENCSSLMRIVFNGPVLPDSTKYFANSSCLTGCPAGIEIVWKSAATSISAGSSSYFPSSITLYYTFDFYNSETDAANCTNKVASVTVEGSQWARSSANGAYGQTSTYLVQIFEFLNGTTDYSSNIFSGSDDSSVPQCPSGKVWGLVVDEDTSLNEYTYMSGSYQVVAVDPADVSYGWVSSPSISAFNSTQTGTTSSGGSSSSSYPALSMESDGSIPELSEIAVYATDGSKLSSSSYTLVFEKATITTSTTSSGRTSTETEWNTIAFSDITEAGTYRVYAVGTGSYASSQTSSVTFVISAPAPTVTTYDGDSMSAYLGTAAYDATVSSASTPAFNVIVPSSDWRNQLLGAGLAGAGGGLLLTDCGSDFSNNMVQAAIQSGSNSYIIVGSSSVVPQSANISDEVYLADFIAERTGTYGTRYGESATTAQELAASAIGTFRPSSWGAAWGSIALVASSTDELVTEAATQYAYENAARVFFLCDDGTIDSSDLETLASSDISQIVIIGDASVVSDEVAASIASSTGKTPTRILEGSTAGLASLELAKQLVAAGTNSYSTVVIADASESANVSTGAVLAASEGGVLLTCRTSADAKAIAAFFESLIAAGSNGAIANLDLIGSFDYLKDAEDYFLSPWSVAYSDLNTTGEITLEVGDTFEVDGFIYELASDGATAELIAVTGSASSANAPESVSYAGETYAVSVSVIAFPDVSANAWYYEAVQFVAARGIMNGYDEGAGTMVGYFDPDASMTRAMMAQVLYNYYGNGAVAAATSHTDVVQSEWYAEAINWVVSVGLMNGDDGARTFRPDDPLTREELAIVFDNVSSVETIANPDAFYALPDYASTSSWAIDSVIWAVGNGVINGVEADGGRMLEPQTTTTRAMVAQVIMNSINGGLI